MNSRERISAEIIDIVLLLWYDFMVLYYFKALRFKVESSKER